MSDLAPWFAARRWMRLLGWSALLAAALPKVSHGVGSGSNEEGDYNYDWTRLRFGLFSVEFHWWPEWERKA